MNVKQKISVDLTWNRPAPIIFAVQGDSDCRAVEMELLANGVPWEAPEDMSVLIRYLKPDGTSGIYDTLPDGTAAWEIHGHVLTVFLAPQLHTDAGNVVMYLTFVHEGKQFSTPRLALRVAEGLNGAEDSAEYTNFATILAQHVGLLDDLQTETKENLVAAVNEVLAIINADHAPIVAVSINADGHLMLTQDGGRVFDAGYVIGPAGTDGRSIGVVTDTMAFRQGLVMGTLQEGDLYIMGIPFVYTSEVRYNVGDLVRVIPHPNYPEGKHLEYICSLKWDAADAIPEGGTVGQVLMMGTDGPYWADLPADE